MDDLTRVLCDYAYDNLLESCYGIQGRRAQWDSRYQAERRIKKLCVDRPELREAIWEELALAAGEDMDAAFTCGLKAGLALR